MEFVPKISDNNTPKAIKEVNSECWYFSNNKCYEAANNSGQDNANQDKDN